MKLTLPALAATFLLAATSMMAHGVEDASRSGAAQPRIIDGTVATSNPGAAAWIYNYKKNGQPAQKVICTASVVHPSWILTAAHCLPDDKKGDLGRFTVRVGSLKSYEGGQERKIDRWEVQKNDMGLPKADVMLVHLTEPLVNATIVELATAEPTAKTESTLYGYGATSLQDRDTPSDVLKTCQATITDPNTTDYMRGPAITSVGSNGGANNGDSGGPQFVNGKQVGVSSMAAPSGRIQMYANVVRHRDWIFTTIGG